MKRIVFPFIVILLLSFSLLGFLIADFTLTGIDFNDDNVNIEFDEHNYKLSRKNTVLKIFTVLEGDLVNPGFLVKDIFIFSLIKNLENEIGTSKFNISPEHNSNRLLEFSISLNSEMAEKISKGDKIDVVIFHFAIISIYGFDLPFSVFISETPMNVGIPVRSEGGFGSALPDTPA